MRPAFSPERDALFLPKAPLRHVPSEDMPIMPCAFEPLGSGGEVFGKLP
ncbi:hypothetical protein KARMA_3672 [Donghicola eburneus]|uniref:Uncharacterized protein n=1 Tax=Donghicola eburneus TaxID=393278 RepID=A0A1M4N3K7_9RHOB|nr:hypothetical protein KARMA_3672 [Donghicola eburneus]